jgi:hypothetical protein
MNGENSDSNGSELDKNNIMKPTFNTLTKEGRKAFEAFRTDLEEPFLSHCKVTRQGTILRVATSIVFHKPEVTREVWPDLLPSHNDIQSMVNSLLERQAKSTDELLRRLIEERDGKNLTLLALILLLLLVLLVSLKLIHK